MRESVVDGKQQVSLYELLQVNPRAKPDVIQAAYRVLARNHHPDVSPDPNAARLMRQLNAAHDVLSDPERRAEYDAQCARSARALGSRPTVHLPRRDYSPRPPVPLPAGERTGSPVAGALVGAAIVAVLALLTFGLWLVSNALDDPPPLVSPSRGSTPGFTDKGAPLLSQISTMAARLLVDG